MSFVDNRKLLRSRKVINEIERYRWIESEKCGFDIGFNKAADHWIVYHALAWLKYHSPTARKYSLRPNLRRSLQSK